MFGDMIWGAVKGAVKAARNGEDDLVNAAAEGAEKGVITGLIKDGASFIGALIFDDDDNNIE